MINIILMLSAVVGVLLSLVNYNAAEQINSVAPTPTLQAISHEPGKTQSIQPSISSKVAEPVKPGVVADISQVSTNQAATGVQLLKKNASTGESVSKGAPINQTIIPQPGQLKGEQKKTEVAPITASGKTNGVPLNQSKSLQNSVIPTQSTILTVSTSAPLPSVVPQEEISLVKPIATNLPTQASLPSLAINTPIIPQSPSLGNPEPKSLPVDMQLTSTQKTAINQQKLNPPISVDTAELTVPINQTTEPELPEEPTADELLGIDTADLQESQGNWLFKRIWWERAENKFEKIKNGLNEILESRHKFFNKRSDLDRTLIEPFYLTVGFSKIELQQLLNGLIKQVEDSKKKQESLENPNNELITTLTAYKNMLEQFNNSITTIIDLDTKIDEALTTLLNAINKVRGYEQQAWKLFKETARILDDKKARANYYQIDGLWKNLKQLQQYIGCDYGTGFVKLINSLKKEIANAEQLLSMLKERKIDLKKEAELVAQGKPSSIIQQPISKIEVEEEDLEEEPGFISRFVINPVKNLFTNIVSIISWPFKKIFGYSSAEDLEESEINDSQEIAIENSKEDSKNESEEES